MFSTKVVFYRSSTFTVMIYILALDAIIHSPIYLPLLFRNAHYTVCGYSLLKSYFGSFSVRDIRNDRLASEKQWNV